MLISMVCTDVAWHAGVVWCGVVWCGVVWCGVVRHGVVRHGQASQARVMYGKAT